MFSEHLPGTLAYVLETTTPQHYDQNSRKVYCSLLATQTSLFDKAKAVASMRFESFSFDGEGSSVG
jgi:hypothetical protein